MGANRFTNETAATIRIGFEIDSNFGGGIQQIKETVSKTIKRPNVHQRMIYIFHLSSELVYCTLRK